MKDSLMIYMEKEVFAKIENEAILQRLQHLIVILSTLLTNLYSIKFNNNLYFFILSHSQPPLYFRSGSATGSVLRIEMLCRAAEVPCGNQRADGEGGASRCGPPKFVVVGFLINF
ncbi:unnamed protein product [Cuscuta epithymum]|uniref:Uncharacterized protein n=1 Tax=Cuscuta epithymum TaxID=186058 RepID=A0AAV0DI08_9ASTE|nr:unnamed protein product [Cuscuta epithymum]